MGGAAGLAGCGSAPDRPAAEAFGSNVAVDRGRVTSPAGRRECSAACASRYSDYVDEFGTVVNVVEAGADPTGEESVVEVIRDLRADDTLLVFPPGEYYIDAQVRYAGFESFGLVGNGATLRPANFWEFEGPRYRLFRLGVVQWPGERLVFEGFDVDQTAPATGVRVLESVVYDGLEVRDVTVRGRHDSGTWGPGVFAIADPDGEGIVERFEAPDGGAWEVDTPNAGELWRGPTGIIANQNRGTLRFKNCVLGPFPDNGLYAGDSEGSVIVEGGVYRNSTPVSVRLGGVGSRVEDTAIVVSEPPEVNVPERDRRGRKGSRDRFDGITSQRGIRIDQGDVEIVDTEVYITHPGFNSHAISVQNDTQTCLIDGTRIAVAGDVNNHGIVVSGDAGRTTIAETHIDYDVPGGYPIWLRDGRTHTEIRDVTIADAAGSTHGFAASIRCDQSNATVEDMTVQHGSRGPPRDGLVDSGDNTTVADCEIYARGYPLVEMADNAHFRHTVARSRGRFEAVDLYESSSNIRITNCTLFNGINDRGSNGLRIRGNLYR